MIAEQEILGSPLANSAPLSYEHAIVTFLDILGFKNMVIKRPAGDVAAALERLQESVNESVLTLATGRKRAEAVSPPRVHSFSDNVVRVRPITSPQAFAQEFIQEISELGRIQASLAGDGIFIRGGIAVDSIVSNESVVFGKGLIRAYEIESKVANSPRIVVDPGAISQFREREDIAVTRMRKDISVMKRLIRQGDDGLWYVDYIRTALDQISSDTAAKTYLKKHRKHIVEVAMPLESDSDLLPKFMWLARYYNSSCNRRFGIISEREILISKSKFPSYERLRLPITPV